ncbi:MAG: CYTH domain-containing protein [Paludibacteraceae bacterium]|nr:CYTH domain-containing protein [Paludibacteraceae bacterium]MCR5298906.1 CYTH domain-containing protein [Paludibacteraceae bacterium]
MAKEIERKFLVTGTAYRSGQRTLFKQGYLSIDPAHTIRVRISDKKAFLTIKGMTKGVERMEYEYQIPVTDAEEMLQNLCKQTIIEKYRYVLPAGNGLKWEVDEFLGANAGLVVAEIELRHSDEQVSLPQWLGREVSGEERFYNSNLSQHPFCEWDEKERR